MKQISGKTVLLTGGSRGLGPHIARNLSREGADIALTARSKNDLNAAAEEIRRNGTRVEIFPADIADEKERERLLDDVQSVFGGIDILVNNAGVEWVSAYTDLAPGFIESMVRTNLIAPMLLTRLVLPVMLARGSGHVVNMSSLGGKRGNPYGGTYSGTKAGLIEWTRGLRRELQDSGVGVSVICPGFVAESGMFAEYNKKPPWISGQTTPEKVAAAVVRAIHKNVDEIIVNPGPAWLIPILDAIHPAIADWLYTVGGVYAFYRRQAEDNLRRKERMGG